MPNFLSTHHNHYKPPCLKPAMNLLFVSEYYPPSTMGGGEISLSVTAKSLVRSGLDVTVLTSRQSGLKQKELIEGVKVIRTLATGKNPQGLLENFKRSFLFPKSVVSEVLKLCRVQHIDIIHFQGSSIIAAPNLKKLKIPLAATIESYPALCPKGDRMYRGKEPCNLVCSPKKFFFCQNQSSEIGKICNRFYLRHNPLFLGYVYSYYRKLNSALSHCHLLAISSYVQKVLKLHGLESVVIPNIINRQAFEEHEKNKKHLFKTNNFSQTNNSKPLNEPGRLKILYLGSLTRYKGPQVLLKAIQGLNCHLDLYGDGPLKKKLQQLIKKNQLDAEIHSPVPYEHIPPLYTAADLIVFPSLWPEQFGRIPLEALAAGKPVVAFNVGAIPETVYPGFSHLVTAGNVPELKEALKKQILKGTGSLNKSQLELEKHKSHLQQFSESSVAQRLINYYKRLMD